jgi:hypothetical protein
MCECACPVGTLRDPRRSRKKPAKASLIAASKLRLLTSEFERLRDGDSSRSTSDTSSGVQRDLKGVRGEVKTSWCIY